MLTPSQLQQLNQIIDNKITMFIGQNISTDLLTTQEKAILRSAGVEIEKINPKDLFVYQSFAMGLISGAVPKSVLNETTYNAFKDYLSSNKMIPLNSYEKGVIRSLERQSFQDIKGIGDRYKKVVERASITAERQYYEDTLRNKISEGIAKKDSLRNISNDIAKELDAFGRDIDRIVQTVSHQAFDEGRAAFFDRNYGKEVNYYKKPYAGACSHCVRLYLTAGFGSMPRLFTLDELRANGTNIGIKAADYKPVIGNVHPYDRCTLEVVPEGYVWNEDKKDFVLPEKTERKVERKSKVSITFGDKKYEV